MEQPNQGRKRSAQEMRASDLPEVELSDVEIAASQAEKEDRVSPQSFAKTKSAIESLPAELRKMIVIALAQADDKFRAHELQKLLEGTSVTAQDVGGIGLSGLFRAGDSIRNLLFSNKTFVPLLKDINFTQTIITELGKTYGYEYGKAAIALGTDAAARVYADLFHKKIIKKDRSFNELKDAIISNDIHIVNFIFKYLAPNEAVSLVNSILTEDTGSEKCSLSLLMHAVLHDRSAIVERLLKVPGIDVNLQNVQGATAVILAAQFGTTQGVEQLIAAGADVNLQSITRVSALLQAARHGFIDIVKKLIAAGADVNLPNQHADTPLMHAVNFGKEKEEVVTELLKVPTIDVNAVNRAGYTALRTAAEKGYSAMVKKLIQHGADLGRHGGRALEGAIKGGHIDTIKELIAAKVDLNQVIGPDGHRILWFVRRISSNNPEENKKYAEIVKLLVDHGALE